MRCCPRRSRPSRPRDESLRCARPQQAERSLVFDYVIAGAGFSGAVVASQMARVLGKKVLIEDRRDHIGGNAYDHADSSGILVHKYGPHIFHTNSKDEFSYLSRFTKWRNYEHRVIANVGGVLVPIPINIDTVNRLYGLDLDETQFEQYLE